MIVPNKVSTCTTPLTVAMPLLNLIMLFLAANVLS
jgi:hypothetical protein